MYLPAPAQHRTKPECVRSAVQASLTGVLHIDGCQTSSEPVSDMVRRKLPLYFGLTLLPSAASVAPWLNIHTLVILPFCYCDLGACAALW
jgi:hypothetical protein